MIGEQPVIMIGTFCYMSFTLPVNIQCKDGRKCLNDTLNTFLNLWLYGVGHMVKNQSDCEDGSNSGCVLADTQPWSASSVADMATISPT